MPWKEVHTMSLRREFVTLASAEGANMQQLCRRFGISRKTGYKWLARFAQGSSDGGDPLSDRSRKPLHSPNRTDSSMEARIIELRSAHSAWGGRKLRRRLRNTGTKNVPAPSTITAILRRHDRLGPTAGQPRVFQRFEADAPNRLWQMDFKGHFPVTTGRRCHPLTVLDDHSRYALGLAACGNERGDTVKAWLIELFRRFGLPEQMLCDNGPPWGTLCSAERHTALAVWLMRLGIAMSHGRPYHPQTQGKDERFHRTLKVELLQQRSFADLADCQRGFDRWRTIYNEERPHDALGLATPASRYRMSPRSYPETLPPLEYDTNDIVRKVACDGRISFRGVEHRIGEAFTGQTIALRATDHDGHFAVYFGRHNIMTIQQNT